jgi:hypothetical protein
MSRAVVWDHPSDGVGDDVEYMRAPQWRPMGTAPLNAYGQAYGPTVLVWCEADNTPWPAYYDPGHKWVHRDVGPAWVIPDQDPAIAPEDAVAWMPIEPPSQVIRAAKPPPEDDTFCAAHPEVEE